MQLVPIRKTAADGRLREDGRISTVDVAGEELVLNAFEAEATTVDVRLDAAVCTVVCTDNGCGIAQINVQFAGQRFRSSKDNIHAGAFCCRGDALAAILETGCALEIDSQAEGEPVQRQSGVGTTVIMSNGRGAVSHSLYLYAAPAAPVASACLCPARSAA